MVKGGAINFVRAERALDGQITDLYLQTPLGTEEEEEEDERGGKYDPSL